MVSKDGFKLHVREPASPYFTRMNCQSVVAPLASTTHKLTSPLSEKHSGWDVVEVSKGFDVVFIPSAEWSTDTPNQRPGHAQRSLPAPSHRRRQSNLARGRIGFFFSGPCRSLWVLADSLEMFQLRRKVCIVSAVQWQQIHVQGASRTLRASP